MAEMCQGYESDASLFELTTTSEISPAGEQCRLLCSLYSVEPESPPKTLRWQRWLAEVLMSDLAGATSAVLCLLEFVSISLRVPKIRVTHFRCNMISAQKSVPVYRTTHYAQSTLGSLKFNQTFSCSPRTSPVYTYKVKSSHISCYLSKFCMGGQPRKSKTRKVSNPEGSASLCT